MPAARSEVRRRLQRVGQRDAVEAAAPAEPAQRRPVAAREPLQRRHAACRRGPAARRSRWSRPATSPGIASPDARRPHRLTASGSPSGRKLCSKLAGLERDRTVRQQRRQIRRQPARSRVDVGVGARVAQTLRQRLAQQRQARRVLLDDGPHRFQRLRRRVRIFLEDRLDGDARRPEVERRERSPARSRRAACAARPSRPAALHVARGAVGRAQVHVDQRARDVAADAIRIEQQPGVDDLQRRAVRALDRRRDRANRARSDHRRAPAHRPAAPAGRRRDRSWSWPAPPPPAVRAARSPAPGARASGAGVAGDRRAARHRQDRLADAAFAPQGLRELGETARLRGCVRPRYRPAASAGEQASSSSGMATPRSRSTITVPPRRAAATRRSRDRDRTTPSSVAARASAKTPAGIVSSRNGPCLRPRS